MNADIILGMVKPYIKDNTITYEQFDKLFSILSRKEQYAVCDLLMSNGINLVDEGIDEEVVLEIGIEDDAPIDIDDDFDAEYDDAIFKDSGTSLEQNEELLINRNIRQSNEILCALIKQGNRQAEQDLCIKNQRLVGKYVTAYKKRYANRLEDEDLEQVGFMGLIKAAKGFDTRQGTAFSTYAVFWIKQAIAREIMDHGYAIRIPVHMMERIAKVTSLNNHPEFVALPIQEKIRKIALELGYTEEMVRECFVLKQNYLGYTSLDAPIGEDDDAALGDMIPYDEEATVEEYVFGKELRKEMEKVLKMLSKRESDILRLRFGWDDGETRTLEEVGAVYGVTRERIRQIESKALRKLRHPTYAKRIKDFG